MILGVQYAEGGATCFQLHDLPQEVSSPTRIIGDTTAMPQFQDGNDLLLGQRSNESLKPLHPTPAQIFWLWQMFLDNINTLVKVVHAPFVQPWVLEAMSDLDKMTPAQEALLFSIYLAALLSVQEEECVNNMGQSQRACTERFTKAAQHALSRADLMRCADLTVLQAFTLFIVSLCCDQGGGFMLIEAISLESGLVRMLRLCG